MKKHDRTRRDFLAGAAALAGTATLGGLSGCGGGGDAIATSSSTAPPVSPPPAPTPAPAPVPAPPPGPTALPFRNARTGIRYATLQAAHDAAQSGDTIKVAGGNYAITAARQPGDLVCTINLNTLTVEWETFGVPAVIDESVYFATQAVNGSNFITMGATCLNLTLRGIHFTGAKDAGNYSFAGVYCLPGYGQPDDWLKPAASLTIEYCKVIGFANGILTNQNHNAKLYLRHSTFKNNGTTGLAHGIYVGKWESVEVTGCSFHNTVPCDGHLMKVQARTTTVRGCYFDFGGFTMTDYGTSEIDFSCGGVVSFAGNILLAGSCSAAVKYGASQRDPLNVSGEGTVNFAFDGRTHSVKFAQNTIRKVQSYFPGNATEVLKIYTIANEDGSLINGTGVPTMADAYGSTIRNNIAGSNNASAANFVTLYASNTAVADTTISDAGTYSGAVIPGNPAVNDASMAWAGDVTVPTPRTDTNRGGVIA